MQIENRSGDGAVALSGEAGKSRRNSEILLAAVIMARSTSYIFSKNCLNNMEPFNLLALRFGLAFILLFIIFRKKIMAADKITVARGALLGGAFFSVMTAETFGLWMTEASTAAFLGNTAIVFVPFFAAAVYKKKLLKENVLSAVLALIGVAFIVLKTGHFDFNPGMLFCLLCAVLYAGSILLTDHFAKESDALVLGIFQVGFMAVYSIIAAFLFGSPILPQSSVEWGCIMGLVVICSVFGFTLQPVAQRGTTPERAGLFCAISPATAAMLGCIFLHERLGIMGLIGGGLILTSIFSANLLHKKQ